jgi:hypothetical protein
MPPLPRARRRAMRRRGIVAQIETSCLPPSPPRSWSRAASLPPQPWLSLPSLRRCWRQFKAPRNQRLKLIQPTAARGRCQARSRIIPLRNSTQPPK